MGHFFCIIQLKGLDVEMQAIASLVWVFLPAPPKFLSIPKKLFDHLRKPTNTTTPKLYRLPEVNISPKVDFQKSKCIIGSRLSKVKMYHRELTSGSKKLSLEVDFRKSKNITEVDFRKSINLCFLTFNCFFSLLFYYFFSYLFDFRKTTSGNDF